MIVAASAAVAGRGGVPIIWDGGTGRYEPVPGSFVVAHPTTTNATANTSDSVRINAQPELCRIIRHLGSGIVSDFRQSKRFCGHPGRGNGYAYD